MSSHQRLPVRRTAKLYVGGQFPRSESGRTFEVWSWDGRLLAHAARASRKDLRDARAACANSRPSPDQTSNVRPDSLLANCPPT